MKKSVEDLKREMEEQMIAAAREQLLNDIFQKFKPHVGPGRPDYEPTSVELANDISETLSVNPNSLAIALIRRGFETKLVGTLFRWQIDYTGS